MSELRPIIGAPPHTAAPELAGYRQVAHERMDTGKLSIAGVALIPLWAVGFLAIVGILGGRSEYSFEFTWRGPFLLLALVVAVTLLHEVIHGVVAAALGARPAFGVGPGIAYTTFLEPMNHAAYLSVGLAPLLFISVAAVAAALVWSAAAGWLITAAIVNASGAIGDLWMAYRIIRSPRGARFYDLADGFAVLAPEPRS